MFSFHPKTAPEAESFVGHASAGVPGKRRSARGMSRTWRHWRRSIGLLMLLWWTPITTVLADQRDRWEPFLAPWFAKVGMDEGLPHVVTTALAQDRRGLLWIGSMGGLVRYDGYRMQVFGAAGAGEPGLPDAYVRCLLALPDGGLLIGTNFGGLARFDPATNAFSVYPIGPDGTADRKIYALSDDHAGGVWIATDLGLDHLDLRSNRITHQHIGPQAVPRNFSVLQDRTGNLWLGNDTGLFVRRVGSQAFVRPPHPEGIVATVLDNQIWAIHEDLAGRIWIGSGQAGVVYLDTDGQWRDVPGFSGREGIERRKTVRDFVDAGDDSIWIGTDGAGVVRYLPGADHVRVYAHDAAMSASLPGDSLRAMLRDRSGNIWVATDLGLARHDTNAGTAFALQSSPLTRKALADPNVHAMLVDARGRIWLGLGDGHIDLIDLSSGTMEHLRLTGSQAMRDAQAFAETPDGSIWVGSLGLARINPDTLAIQESMQPGIDDQPVLSLHADGHTLLIGTYNGAYRYDTRAGRLEHFKHDPADPTSLASDTVREIAAVGSQTWYGTTHGISIATHASDNQGFVNLVHRADDPSSLPQDYIGAIRSDDHSRLWISTFGGLAVRDHDPAGGPHRFRTIGVAQGLASNKINVALPDLSGNIWASMSNGIARIDGSSGKISNLGPRDGLHLPSYIHIAAARLASGDMLFGGMGGLTVIRPDQRSARTAAAPLAITSAETNEMSLPFGALPDDGGSLIVKAHDRNLAASFALLDFRAPQQVRYSYKMDGLDDRWQTIPGGSMPTAIYTNLPHGNYTLHLRAITHGMYPQTAESRITVVVIPLWYETLTSKIIAALLLVAGIMWLVHLRTLYLRSQARRLQREINEHTRDLRIANLRLKELAGTDGLTGAYNRRRFMELAQSETARDHRACLVLFDLDRFKQVNDTYGHLAGDAVIRRAIEVIRLYSRQGDLVGRYGGEEFVLCLPGTGIRHAQDTAERIRTALAASVVTHELRSIPVTISAGVAAMREGESFEHCLSRADSALYEAKHRGRNCCVAAD